MAEDSAVQVCVRVRPLIEREESASENAQEPKYYWKTDDKSVHQVDHGKSFSFDCVFNADETTDQLYRTVAKPLVVSTVQGYNGTIFAYGQTSSGKTFTMMGDDQSPGVIPLAVEEVFQTINNLPNKEFLLRVSYMEIYNETVSDLLVDSWKRKPLEVRETLDKNVYVADLTEELVTNSTQVMHWIRIGEKNRHYGKTKMNQRSSRSHTIFRMILESRERNDSENADGAIVVSHLNLVDLAGSERASQTGAEGARFKEGCNINRSLFTLGQVIKKLTDEGQKGFTNYRDSKLTRILQNSLGGNARTVIICTITPVAFDETLSTLQFASTAKKMKNDPHVTEVSDDGALLKRYRNEIVDLKRRLHEVSSVTQTTVTEKAMLSQLLQEKDQLQREQEDRIRNLTNLLVSSTSNQVAMRQLPKRRVTWGGKMVKLAACSDNDGFLGSSSGKRKVNHSCIEPDEEFYSPWDILKEQPEDMDTSQVSITVRSFGDSPKDYMSPDRLHELSRQVSSLEQQLESERSQKSEVELKVKALDERVAELELEVVQHRQTDLQLKARTEENLELEEKKKVLEERVANQEKLLQEPAQTGDTKEMQRQLLEAIQLCETLAGEKDLLCSERNYLNLELGMSHEQIKMLEKENLVLQQELKEKRDLDDFERLEEQVKDEDKLNQQISQLKTSLESSERKGQDVQHQLEALLVELKQKSDFIEDLQKMNGKDLVEKLAMLQRSLEDAEKLSRDTKKDWAFLRSENITLEEKNVMLVLDNKKKGDEVSRLHSQLEAEKSKFKKMQGDLQKELNIAFEENTKLTSLLDGKVPKHLIDNMELERTVTQLNKELSSCQETNADLCVKLEELKELPVKLNELMKQLEESEHFQVSLTEELHEILQLKKDLEEKLAHSEEARRTDEDIHKELEDQHNDLVKTLQEQLEEKMHQLSREEANHQQRVAALELQMSTVAQELVTLRQEEEENRSLVASLTEERDQLKVDLQENIEMMIEVQDELRVTQEKNLKQKDCIKELQTAQASHICCPAQQEELLAETKSLREELKLVEAERQRSTQEVEILMSRVNSLTEDREQLQQALDTVTQEKLLDDRTDMVSLHSELSQAETQENMAKLHQEIQHLQASLQAVSADKSHLESDLQQNMKKLDEMQRQLESLKQNETNFELERLSRDKQAELELEIKILREELERVEAERQSSTQELETLVSKVNFLTEEREQLQQALDTVTQEKQQLLDDRTDMVSLQNELSQAETQENMAKLQQEMEHLQASLQTISEDKSRLQSDLQQNIQSSTQELETLVSKVNSLTEDREQLQQALDTITQEKQQLLDDRTDMASLHGELNQAQENMAKLQQEIEHLQVTLQTVSADKSRLESDLQQNMQKIKTLQEEHEHVEAKRQSSTQELETLESKVNSLTAEREQLQQALDTVTQEKQQLLDTMASLQSELSQAKAQENMAKLQQEIEHLQTSLLAVSADKSHLESDLQQNMQKLDEMQRHLESLERDVQKQSETNLELERCSGDKQAELELEIKTLREELERVEAERLSSTQELETLVSKVNFLTEERVQLQQALDTVSQEKQQLLDNRTDMMEHLQASLQTISEDKSRLEHDLQQNIQSSTQELETLVSKVNSLTEDREQLQRALDTVTQEKQQLQQLLDNTRDMLQAEKSQINASLHMVREEKSRIEGELRNNMEMISQKQELLRTVEEQLSEHKKINNQLTLEHSSLKQQLESVTERLQIAETSGQSSTQELETLVSQVSTLTQARERLQQDLDAVTQEKQQLLDQTVEKLEPLKELTTLKKNEAEVQGLQQLLSEANQTISSLREQLSCPREERPLSLLLGDSAQSLQNSLKKFTKFSNICSSSDFLKVNSRPSRARSCMHSLPKSTTDAFFTVSDVSQQALQSLGLISEHMQKCAQSYQRLFEGLVKKDLAVFEEKRLQDILLCRVQAPDYSIKDMDFMSEWKPRLKEVQEKRQFYLQKMTSVLDSFWATFRSELSTEAKVMDRFETQLKEVCSGQPVDVPAVEAFLSAELQLRTNLLHRRNSLLKTITEEHKNLLQELSELDAQTQAQLLDDRSKRCTLLQGLEGAPLKTELSLIQENQKLQGQLCCIKDHLESLSAEKEELQKAQVKADHRVSTHKEATQLLQTELQDTCAKLQEQERTIEELKARLQQLKAEDCVVEKEKLQSKVCKLEMEFKLSSEKYKDEIQKLTSLLEAKEVSLRKLKETLRSQQNAEDSYLEGEALHAHLVQPKGLVNLDKTRLEEEARKLKLRIIELESLVSSLQAEVGKWKQRAIKMKSKTETETKLKRERGLDIDCSSPRKVLCESPMKHLRSPRKGLDSPLLSQLSSPKSRFFDGGNGSELLVRNCPKQFFDDPRLGTTPELLHAPETEQTKLVSSDPEAHVAKDWLPWPMSPKTEEMCKKQ